MAGIPRSMTSISAATVIGLASLSGDDWMRAVYLVALLAFVASGVLYSRGNLGQNLRSLAAWAGIISLIIIAYAFKDEGRMVWQRFAAALVPGYAIEAEGELSVSRAADGMFAIEAKVNGAPVRFLFDTGASSVLLTVEDARRAGIAVSDSSFYVTVMTANGEARAAPVTISELSIGNLVRRNVSALVAQAGATDESLLGHSFLESVDSYEVRGDRLIIRYR